MSRDDSGKSTPTSGRFHRFGRLALLLLRRFALWALVLVLLLWGCDRYVTIATSDWVYSTVESLPGRHAGLVLGTSRRFGGELNPFYTARIDAAVQLYRAGKVQQLIASGDNRTQAYNEPRMLRRDMVRAGVPSEAIIMDFAGFRTLDSVVRAQEVFGESRFVIISQRFQVERALYIARSRNIDAIGFVAESPRDFDWSWRVRIREVFARFLAVLDVNLLNTMPRFLGAGAEGKPRT